jgi:hypothetical protein
MFFGRCFFSFFSAALLPAFSKLQPFRKRFRTRNGFDQHFQTRSGFDQHFPNPQRV